MLLIFCFCTSITAQNITELEYFFGADPGFGNGTAVSANSNSGELTQSLSLPLSGLDEGFQKLTIRAKDDQNTWGLYDMSTFYISEVSNFTLSDIATAEYWFDADPGFGNGTALAISGTPEITQSYAIPVNALDAGFHSLSIRTQNLDGTWGLYDKRIFYITDESFGSVPPVDVTALEYYFDADPGFGNGTALGISVDQEVNQNFIIPINDLDDGFHSLSIRSQNADGTWSLYDKRVFYVFPEEDFTPSPITEMEFLYDAELGFGTGETVPVTPTANPDEYIVEIPTDMVSCDIHDLWVSLKNADGNYSLYNILVDVEVFDDAPPTIQVYDNITVFLDANGEGNLMIDQVDNGTFDDCTLVSVELNQALIEYTCADLGVNTVTVTATDAVGKVSTLDVPVTVVDNIDPVAVTFDITVQLDENGEATIDPDDVDGGSTDNCSIDNKTLDITSFGCDDLGPNTVTLTVFDESGNSNSTTAIVTVEETEPPVVVTQDITVELDANGDASITANDIDNGSSDNCGIDTLVLDITDFDCTDVGANTVTLTATDNVGLMSSGTAIVTIQDNLSPIAITQDISIQLDANGEASISSGDIDNGSSDNCGIASLSLDITDFDCTDVGDNNVTLSVEDDNGNTSTETAVVTVEDVTNPTVITQDISLSLDALGAASITANDIDNSSFDNCGLASLSLDITDFDCTDVGANTVTLTATDNNGLVASAQATVTVEDDSNPIVVTQNITIQLDTDGEASISAADIDNGSSDNCGIASLSLDVTNFDCSNVGDNTVTLSVEDVNGNISTDTAVVTVEDDTDPKAVTQDITISLDANGLASIDPSDINDGSSDNCGIATLSLDITDFDCSDIGDNTVTLTVEDLNGNTNSNTAVVTVQDDLVPVVVTQDIIVQLDDTGNATISVSDIDNGSSDNCGIASSSLDITSFTTDDLGPNTVTLTIVDVNGNSSFATAIVTVEVETDIVVITQDITVELDANGEASITPDMIDNGSTTCCGNTTLSLNKTDFDCSDLGLNTVILTVSDGLGNSSSATANVTVEDNILPVAVTQDLTVELEANGEVSIMGIMLDGGSTDNCGIVNYSLDVSSFDCSNLGLNVVTLTVTDASGNSDSAPANVTVEDNLSPTVVTQDITVQLDGSGNASITPAMIDNGSTDNCGIASSSLDITSFTTSDLGPNTVTLTVVDVNGNSSFATAIVTVEVQTDITVITQDITVELGANGDASITPDMIDNGSTTCCGNTTLSLNITAFDCSDLGLNTVTLTVSDGLGNSNSSTASVTVVDNISPVAFVQDITVQLDSDGNASISDSDVDDGSFDNCSIVSSILDVTSFDCSDLGTNDVTLTVTDSSGNSDSAIAVVNVEDNLAPIVITQDITVQLDGSGNAIITAPMINDGSSDNCGIASLSVSPALFTTSDIGANTVTLTVTDVNGNSNSATATVTVQDQEDDSPVAIAHDITVQVDANGQASITPAMVDNGSTVDSGVATLSLDITNFDCSNLGPNTVTLTVTDEDNNSDTATAVVTVEDSIAPTALVQNIIVQLDADGNASISASDIDNGSSDNCGIVSSVLDIMTFDCSNLGTNNVMLTVSDTSGNSDSATAIVTVQDKIAPTVSTQNVTVQLDAFGLASITTVMIEDGSFDNCVIVSLSLDQMNFDSTNLGANTVTLTVTDQSSNSASTTAQVTVIDAGTAPTLAFQEALTVPIGIVSGSVAFSDVDFDGDQDFLLSGVKLRNSFGFIGTQISWLYKNDGNGNFTKVNGTPFLGLSYSSVSYKDINNDNVLDIISSGEDYMTGDNFAKYYANDGTGNFSETTGESFPPMKRVDFRAADFDNDGDDDVLFNGIEANGLPGIRLFRNQGTELNPSYSFVSSSIAKVIDGSIDVADVNGDNTLDVFISGRLTNGTKVSRLYLNNGNFGFSLLQGTPFVGVDSGDSAFADVDDDGDQDLLITGLDSNNNTVLKLYLNDGSGTFTEAVDIFTISSNYLLKAFDFADIDGDGDFDVLFTGYHTSNFSRITTIWENLLYSPVLPKGSDNSFSIDNSFEENEIGFGKDFKVFPNPTDKGYFNIYTPDLEGEVSIVISDVFGRRVVSQNLSVEDNHITVSFGYLSGGTYLVTLKKGDLTFKTKLIVE